MKLAGGKWKETIMSAFIKVIHWMGCPASAADEQGNAVDAFDPESVRISEQRY
jgi:hypothetical protein